MFHTNIFIKFVYIDHTELLKYQLHYHFILGHNFNSNYQEKLFMHAFIESHNTNSPQISSPESSSELPEFVKLASQNPKKRAGRKTFKETRHPVYRGVRSRDSGKWVCEVREPVTQSRVWLGSYPTPEMAARAHDVAVLAMRGRSACLNFADSVWRLPVPESNNVRDIQKTARKAAEAFRDTEVVVEKEMKECGCYEDEEEMYGTPEFINSLAEALMVPPPQTVGYGESFDNVEICDDMSLWGF